MLNIRWCAFTGALMLAFVCVTFLHKEVARDPEGVQTRWWDGTTQSVETKYPNGKPQTRTEYSDDGKTVLVYKEWDWDGSLVTEKVRHKDGKVEEKIWYRGGKQLQSHALWLGDESTYIVRLVYYANGKVASEEQKTEDGVLTVRSRRFNEQGVIQESTEIRDNADNVRTSYTNGKKSREIIVPGTGDVIVTSFWPNEKVRTRQTDVKLTGDEVIEMFYENGDLQLKRTTRGDTYEFETLIYARGDKLKVRQTSKRGQLSLVEEYGPNGKMKRAISVVPHNYSVRATEVKLYREDGTLEKLKLIDGDGKTTRTIDYSADGKTVAGEREGGEPEKIDERLFSDRDSEIDLLAEEGLKQ